MARFALVIALLLAVLSSCTGLRTPDAGRPLPDDAQQLPQEAQQYIEMSRDALAEQLRIAPEQIVLESVTAPPVPDGIYIIKLVVGDKTYTYHGEAGQISLVTVTF